MLFRIAPGLAYSPGAAIVDGFRDAAIAVLAMMLIPHAYNITAGALNSFTEALMGPAGAAIVSQMAGTAIAWGIFFMIISFFSPGAGFLGFSLLLTVFLISALTVVRWFLLLAGVTASPFLVLAWLHPALRGAAEQVKGLVGAMLVAGPLAAVFTTLFAKIVLGDSPWQQLGGSFVLSWLGIFVVGMLPTVVSGLAVSGLERTVAGRLEAQAMRGAPQVGRAIASGAAAGAVRGAAAAGAAGYSALAGAAARNVRLARPLVDTMRSAGVMVGKARAAVSKALSGIQHGVEDRASYLAERVEAGRKILQLGGLKAGLEEIGKMPAWMRKREAGKLVARLDEMREEGLLSREQYQELLENLGDPAEAIQTIDRIIAETEKAAQEYEQLDEYRKQKLKADLATLRIVAQPIAKGIGNARKSTRELEERALRKIGLLRRGLALERLRQPRRRQWEW
jgi:hypothetical protein